MKGKEIIKRLFALTMVLALIITMAPIDKIGAAAKKPATSIKFTNKTDAKNLIIGDSVTLKASMKPSKTTDKITWTSNSSNIKVNKKGKLTAVKKGTAKITAKTTSGKKATLKVKVTDKITVSTQKELTEALSKKNLSLITVKTDNDVSFTIPSGTYNNTKLVVNAPNADVTNSALFKNVRIDAVKPATWTEKAKGNTFNLRAPMARLIIEYGAEVNNIFLRGEKSDIVLNGNIKGNITFVENIKAELNLTGSTSSEVKVVVNAEGAKFTTNIKSSVALNASAELNFEKGSEESSITKSNDNIKETIIDNTDSKIYYDTGKKEETTVETTEPAGTTAPTDSSGGGGGGGGGGGAPIVPTPTAPSTTQPTTVPTTESTTASTTEPTTASTTEPTTASTTEPTTEAPTENPNSLKGAFKDYFSVGNAVTPEQLKNSTTLAHIKEHYNSITMENVMKPQYILGSGVTLINKEQAEFPVPNSYSETKVPKLNFTTIDEVLEIAKNNGLSMRGHTLVWHSQTPSWFFKENYSITGNLVSAEIMNQRMEYYIQQVLLHVQTKAPGVIYAWDVVNEIFEDDGSLRKAGSNMGAGESLWTSIYNSNEFALKAFEYADKYREDGVKLFYNDYNEYMFGKSDAIFNLAKTLYEKGHIDGIGMQSHLDVVFPHVELIGLAIEKFASVAEGFEVQLTEVDVTINFNNNNGSTLANQADYYGNLTKMILEKKKAGANITNITFWGLYDEVSWRKINQPLLFKEGFVPKDSYTSVMNAVKGIQ